MKILILDDDDFRHQVFAENLTGHSVTHTRNSAEFFNALGKEQFDIVFLDHDLGDIVFDPYKREITGTHVAQGMVDKLDKIPKCVIHSWNPSGAQRMRSILSRKCQFIIVSPFSGAITWFENILSTFGN